jgi:hypothetical protein
VGAKLVPSTKEAFQGLRRTATIDPERKNDEYEEAYRLWLEPLTATLKANG